MHARVFDHAGPTGALAMARSAVLPSALRTASAPRTEWLSRLNGWPACSPTDASPTPSRLPAHGSGPMRFATPSSQWTCTTYPLPVSRRTLKVNDTFRPPWVGVMNPKPRSSFHLERVPSMRI